MVDRHEDAGGFIILHCLLLAFQMVPVIKSHKVGRGIIASGL